MDGLDWEVTATQDSMQELCAGAVRFPPVYVVNQSLFVPRTVPAESEGLEVPEDAEIPEVAKHSQALCDSRDQEPQKQPTVSLADAKVLNTVAFQPFYLHLMVFRADVEMIRRFFKMSPLNLSTLIDETDHRGNTALILAVKLSYLSPNFYDIVRVLLAHGANPRIRDAFGWSALDAAIAKGDRDLAGLLLDAFYSEKMKKWEAAKTQAVAALLTLPDFYMELKWEFDSSVIPLVSKFAPHDTCKIWKVGSRIRLDMTLVGWKKLRSKRRNVSLLFKGLHEGNYRDIVLINYSKKMAVYPLEPLDPIEREAVLTDIMQADSVQGELSFRETRVTPVSGWTGKPVLTSVGKWQCAKMEVQTQAVMNYIKRGQGLLLVKEREYFSKITKRAPRPTLPPEMFLNCPILPDTGRVDYADPCPTTRVDDSQYHNIRKGKVLLWVSRDFPVRLRDFLPVLEMLAPGNTTIMKLHEFLTNAGFAHHVDMFPVKLELPLSLSIKGLVTFTRMEVGPVHEDIMRIPEFRFESRRIAQKTMSSPKKRLMLANMAV